MNNEYTYAVARVKAKEMSLLSKSDIDTLITSRSVDECLRFLIDRGWTECKDDNFEQMLKDEKDKVWSIINELVGDDEIFNVFRCPIDFHNVKAAIKTVATNTENPERFFIDKGTISAEKIYTAIRENDFQALPEHLRECADEAFHKLIKTGDGQLCDIIVDRKSFEYLLSITSASKCRIVRDYGELTTAAANIKTAVRCLKTGKTLDFIKQALAPCCTLNVSMLAEAASKNLDAICNYLTYTDYSPAVDYLKKSSSEFEKYFDNILMEKIKEQKSDFFTIAPIVSYYLARENEFKNVRMILSGKQNEFDEQIIKERLRKMYV